MLDDEILLLFINFLVCIFQRFDWDSENKKKIFLSLNLYIYFDMFNCSENKPNDTSSLSTNRTTMNKKLF